MRESVRIIYQCINQIPNGLYKSPDNKVRQGSAVRHNLRITC